MKDTEIVVLLGLLLRGWVDSQLVWWFLVYGQHMIGLNCYRQSLTSQLSFEVVV